MARNHGVPLQRASRSSAFAPDRMPARKWGRWGAGLANPARKFMQLPPDAQVMMSPRLHRWSPPACWVYSPNRPARGAGTGRALELTAAQSSLSARPAVSRGGPGAWPRVWAVCCPCSSPGHLPALGLGQGAVSREPPALWRGGSPRKACWTQSDVHPSNRIAQAPSCVHASCRRAGCFILLPNQRESRRRQWEGPGWGSEGGGKRP